MSWGSTCPSCGQALTGTASCQHCGYAPPPPVMTAAQPAETPAASTASGPSTVPGRRDRSQLVALGLLVVGLIVWGSRGPLGSIALFMPAVAGTAALIGETFSFSWYKRAQERLPKFPWAQLYPIAVWGLLVVAVMRAGMSLGFILFGVGLLLLIRRVPTALGPLDLRLTWSTWPRRVMVIALLLAGLTLSSQWDGDFESSYQYDCGDYSCTASTTMAGKDGYDTGHARWLGPLLVLALVAMALRPVNPPAWQRFAPLAAGGAAAALGFMFALADNREIQELHEIGGGYPKFNAEGPPWFTIMMVVFCIAAAVQAFRRRRSVSS